jgi:hypothetical protein
MGSEFEQDAASGDFKRVQICRMDRPLREALQGLEIVTPVVVFADPDTDDVALAAALRHAADLLASDEPWKDLPTPGGESS